jgi:hypothetical protein
MGQPAEELSTAVPARPRRGGSPASGRRRPTKVEYSTVRASGSSPRPRWRPGEPPKNGGPAQIRPPLLPGQGRGRHRLGTVDELRSQRVPPWAVFVPPDATSIEARAQRVEECLRQIAALAPDSWVSIVDDGPLGRWRLRRLAKRSGLVIERELVVLPAVDTTVIVEDATRTRWRAPGGQVISPFAGGLPADLPVALWPARWLRSAWRRRWTAERLLLARRR